MGNLSQIQIDRSSIIPYYFQLKEQFRALIEEEVLSEGEQIPSENELCRNFGVSRTVVRQAINELVNEGLLSRRKGKGTFVARPKIIGSLMQNLTGFYKDMAEKHFRTTTRVLELSVVGATRKLVDKLRLSPAERVIKIARLRFVNDEPIVYVVAYIPYNLCPALVHEDLSTQSLYAVLEDRFRLEIVRSRRSIEAIAATEQIASVLDVDINAPLLLLKSISYLKDGRPVEYYEAKHRGDRSGFEVELIRRPGQGFSEVEEFTFEGDKTPGT